MWILGAYFHLPFRHILYICKTVTLFSVCQGNSIEVWTQLFMVTTLLVFLYFLVLSWACLFYCILKWNIAFYFFIDLYMGKQKPILVFSSTFSGWGSQGLPTKKMYHLDSSILKVIQCTNVDVIM